MIIITIINYLTLIILLLIITCHNNVNYNMNMNDNEVYINDGNKNLIIVIRRDTIIRKNKIL